MPNESSMPSRRATGCVYAWEERGPHSEITGLGIERFTEGRRWSPSRVRDEFLFYYEKYTPHPDASQIGVPLNTNPPRNWDPLVKQTYSVWVDTPKGRRKWHLTAYFTQTTVDDLRTIDDIPGLQGLVVPPGLFKSTRISKGRAKSEDETPRPSDPPSKPPHTYAPFSSLYNRYPNELASAPSVSDSVLMYEPYPNSKANPYPNQYPTTPPSPIIHEPVYLQPVQPSTQYSHNPYPISTFSPAAQYQSPSQITPYPGPITVLNTTTSVSNNFKTYQTDSSPQPDYRCRPHHSPTSSPLPSIAPSPSQWMRTSAETLDPHLPPLHVSPGSYTFPPTTHRGPEHPRHRFEHSDSSSTTSSNGSDPASRSREAIPMSRAPTLEPSYELHSQHPPGPSERRGSIGPDRDLASIHTLTRRHPYRRDPLDDRALRLLPP